MPSAPLSYNFDAGTNGNTVATTDTGSGDQWSTVQIDGASAFVYDNTHPSHGAMASKLTSGGGANTAAGKWTGLGSITSDFYTRQYHYIPTLAAPGISFYFTQMKAASAAICAQFAIFSDGTMLAFDGTAAFVTGSGGSISAATGQLIRVETHVIPAVTNGTVEWRLFNTADSTTADDTKIVSTASLAANIDSVDFGIVSGTSPAAGWVAWMDDIKVSTAGWIGPVPSVLPQPSRMYLARTAANF